MKFFRSFYDLYATQTPPALTNKNACAPHQSAILSAFAGHRMALFDAVKRDQDLITDMDDYYIARDVASNTVYMCFRDLMVIDIDTDSKHASLELLGKSNERFLVYETRRGLHAFCVSKKWGYTDCGSALFALDLGCDYFYAVYASIRGWCVRLNQKLDEFVTNADDGTRMYTFLGAVGGQPGDEDASLVRLAELHAVIAHRYERGLPCCP